MKGNIQDIVEFVVNEVRSNTTEFQYIVTFDEVENKFGKLNDKEKELLDLELSKDERVADVVIDGNEIDVVLFTDFV